MESKLIILHFEFVFEINEFVEQRIKNDLLCTRFCDISSDITDISYSNFTNYQKQFIFVPESNRSFLFSIFEFTN